MGSVRGDGVHIMFVVLSESISGFLPYFAACSSKTGQMGSRLLEEGMEARGLRIKEDRKAGAERGIQRTIENHVLDCLYATVAVGAEPLLTRDPLPPACFFCPPVGASAPLRQRFPPPAFSHAQQILCRLAQAGWLQAAAAHTLGVMLQLAGAVTGGRCLQQLQLPLLAAIAHGCHAHWLGCSQIQLHPYCCQTCCQLLCPRLACWLVCAWGCCQLCTGQDCLSQQAALLSC